MDSLPVPDSFCVLAQTFDDRESAQAFVNSSKVCAINGHTVIEEYTSFCQPTGKFIVNALVDMATGMDFTDIPWMSTEFTREDLGLHGPRPAEWVSNAVTPPDPEPENRAGE